MRDATREPCINHHSFMQHRAFELLISNMIPNIKSYFKAIRDSYTYETRIHTSLVYELPLVNESFTSLVRFPVKAIC